MASDFDPQDALDAIAADRRRIGERMTAETRWAAPAQGAGVALLVAAPIAGLPGMGFVAAAATLLLIGVERLFRRRSGLTINWPAGTGGALILVVLGLGVAAFSLTSLWFWISDQTEWIVPLALGAGVFMTLGVVAYDRVFAREVSRA